MDAAFRRLFTRKSKRKTSSHRLRHVESQPYESVAAAKPPTRGTYPVGGNGPTPVIRPRPLSRLRPPPQPQPQPQPQHSRRPSIELVAEPPSVPRRRRYSDGGRPQTAPQGSFVPARNDADQWPPSRYSAIIAAPPTLRRRSYRPPPTERSAAKRVRSMIALTSEVQPVEERRPYVDLLEAFWHLKPSRETYVGRTQASGRRDYGEDVADRNIADYGSLAVIPSYTSTDSYLRRLHARLHGDGTGDDMTSDMASTSTTQPRRGQIGGISTSTPTQDDSQPHVVRTFANTAEPRFNTRGLRLRARPHSAFADSRAFGIPSSRPASVMSAATDLQSPARPVALPLRSSPWVPPARNRSRSASKERSPLVAGLAPFSTEGGSSGGRVVATDQYRPTSPAAPPRLSGQGSLLTPPISPVTNSPIERSSLDKGPPPLQRTGSRDQYSTDKVQESPPNTADGVPAAIMELEGSNLSAQQSLKKRPGRMFEESADEPKVETVIDPTDSTDIEVITHQQPAVVHEYVTSKVHEIREEQITREIHHHDVFHRIQPIIDVEILPTKNYIPSPSGNGLIEIPESEVPGRRKNWEITPIETNGTRETEPPVEAPQPNGNLTMIQNGQPAVSDENKIMVVEDIPREETTWRHLPELEDGGQRTGQTVPIDIYHDDYDDYDDYSDGRSSIGGQEEELLFKDNEAFGGRLPGLDDWNPVIPSADPPSIPPPRRIEVPESEATRALKRRQAEVTKKMAAMSVEE